MERTATYAYAVGRVKALEARLIDPVTMQRMIDAADFDEALRYLADSDYSGKVAKGGLEDALFTSLKATFDDVASFSPDPYFVGVFFSEYDFLKLKACIKQEILRAAGIAGVSGKPPELGFLPYGQVMEIAAKAVGDRQKGSEAEKGGQFAEEAKPDDDAKLRRSLAEAAANAVRSHDKAGDDPMEIDSAVDSAFYAYVREVVSSRHADWALRIAAAKADMANLLLLLRSIAAGKDSKSISSSVVPGGLISKEDIMQSAAEGSARLRRVLEAGPYLRALEPAFETWAKDGQIRQFEMAADLCVFGMAKEAKALTEGYAPVMGYLLMKQQEVSMMRRILAGKAKGLHETFIRERLCGGNA